LRRRHFIALLGGEHRVVERPFLDGVPRAETEKRS
jgi:hypothetical protein